MRSFGTDCKLGLCFSCMCRTCLNVFAIYFDVVLASIFCISAVLKPSMFLGQQFSLCFFFLVEYAWSKHHKLAGIDYNWLHVVAKYIGQSLSTMFISGACALVPSRSTFSASIFFHSFCKIVLVWSTFSVLFPVAVADVGRPNYKSSASCSLVSR